MIDGDKLPERLALDVLFRFHFNGNQTVVGLNEEINLNCRVLLAEVVNRDIPEWLDLFENKVLRKGTLEFAEHIITCQHKRWRRLR